MGAAPNHAVDRTLGKARRRFAVAFVAGAGHRKRSAMKIPALSIALLALLPSMMAGATEDTKSFVDHFHDDANIPSYVALVDGLIDAGEAKIYASMEDEKKDSRSPRARTPNGILMLYTVAHTPDGVLVHFSTSRAPYLPTALGKHIVGLFMARSGWPKPVMFSVSDRCFTPYG